jgi:hypothetical protein
MTPLSKVKTLIDYAKFGMWLIGAHNWDGKNDRLKSLHFPNGMRGFNDLIQYATALTGGILSFSGNGYAQNNTTIEYINLPKCTSIGDWGAFNGLMALKECHLPLQRRLTNNWLCNAPNLEILEVGALTLFQKGYAMVGNPKVHTFIIGKDTNCSLYLHNCPLLTQECLHNIIDNLADATGLNALTLQVHQDVYDRISEEYKTKLTNKNWNLAVGS